MEITLMQGIFLSIWAFIAGIDRQAEAFFIFRPIIVSTVAGIILGDPATGAVVGGLTELAFAGLTMVGGATPPDPLVAGMMGAVFAIAGKMAPTTALGLAIPFCILMQYLVILVDTLYVFWNKTADKMIDECNTKGIVGINIAGLCIIAAFYMVFTFLSTYVLQDALNSLIGIIPDWFLNGLEVAGGIMPALGFGMLLMVMYKVKYLPFLIIGFLGACFIEFDNLMPIALIGVAFAMFNFYFGRKEEDGGATAAGGEESAGI